MQGPRQDTKLMGSKMFLNFSPYQQMSANTNGQPTLRQGINIIKQKLYETAQKPVFAINQYF